MKWRFSCYVCGHRYELQHRQTHKDQFYGGKKEGRPMMDCPNCELNDCETMIVGEMVGGRT